MGSCGNDSIVGLGIGKKCNRWRFCDNAETFLFVEVFMGTKKKHGNISNLEWNSTEKPFRRCHCGVHRGDKTSSIQFLWFAFVWVMASVTDTRRKC